MFKINSLLINQIKINILDSFSCFKVYNISDNISLGLVNFFQESSCFCANYIVCLEKTRKK
jgi:hypothetical protein